MKGRITFEFPIFGENNLMSPDEFERDFGNSLEKYIEWTQELPLSFLRGSVGSFDETIETIDPDRLKWWDIIDILRFHSVCTTMIPSDLHDMRIQDVILECESIISKHNKERYSK